jgi:colicin import membrane protein
MAWQGTPMNAQALAVAGGPALRPTEPDAWGPGMLLALLAHVLLVAALAWGVNWRSHTEDAQEAELWSAIPEAAAPPPAPLEVPQPVAPPPAAEPPPVVAEPVPDLIIAKKPVKEPKAKPERKHAEPREVFDATPPKPRKVDPTDPPADVKARQLKEAKEAKEKAARDKAAQDKLATLQAQQRAQQQAEQAAAALEAQRVRNLSEIVKRAGGQGSPSASGQAARSAGPSAGYRGRLIALFKRNIINLAIDEVPGNPEAVVDLVMAPDGTILSKTLRTSSGVASWDEAVLRAIDRTEILPPDETGKVPSRMTIGFRPRDN